MNQPLIVTQLLAKRAEVEAQIESLQTRLVEARADLLHIVATIRLFDCEAVEGAPAKAYHGVAKAVRRSELFVLCREALEASSEPLCTRQLASHVIVSENWDRNDRRLRLTIAHRVGAMMTRFEKRGIVRSVGARDRATLWALTPTRGRFIEFGATSES